MTDMRRDRLQQDARRAQFLAKGRELFNAMSYDEVSIDDIARALGISKGLLYHYFPNKRSYYVATVQEAAAEMIALTSGGRSLPKEERLRRGLEAYLDYVQQNRRAYATLLRSGVGADPEVAKVVDRTREVLLERVARGVGVARPRGALRLALRGWIGFVEASALEWNGPRDVPREALVLLLQSTLASAIAGAQAVAEPRRRAPARRAS